MYSVQEYCRRLPTEILQKLLRDHQQGKQKQCVEIIELIEEILLERDAKE